MRYYVECELGDFEAWSGAVAVMAALRENDEAFGIIETEIEEWSDTCGGVSQTDINDFLRFEVEDFLWDNYRIDLMGDHADEDEEDEDE